jgi:hypothetical protein
MPQTSPRAKGIGWFLAGTGVLLLGFVLGAGSETSRAAPFPTAGPKGHASVVEGVRIYRRGRTPIYPYYYNPGRPGGYSFYFGFVPYAPGDIENQALQRQFYPQDTEWPPGLYGGPRPGWGPKRSD